LSVLSNDDIPYFSYRQPQLLALRRPRNEGQVMDSLTHGPVAELLVDLHRQADLADKSLKEQVTAAVAASGKSLEEFFSEKIAGDKANYQSYPDGHAERFLAVSASYGRLLYTCVRASRATQIVEFGTSMGISTLYLAAGLRDNGGGRLIGTEIEPGKVVRARNHVDKAGLSDLVEIREGDARHTLRDVGDGIDLVLLDGAFPLYLAVLKLIERRLRSGALVLAENAFEREYLDYVRDPSNGYRSQPLMLDDSRGNEFSVVTR
jgi:predicted O-methyltransferase YrrM